MSPSTGWIIKQAACEACGGRHDLYFDVEPVLHRDIVFTCPITDTGTRLRLIVEPQPTDEPPVDSLAATIK